MILQLISLLIFFLLVAGCTTAPEPPNSIYYPDQAAFDFTLDQAAGRKP